jgi:acetyl-CoA C-acetyltransferase
MARRMLGLAADASMTVTGGLTFFGGPGNNYMTHAATAMVRALRAGSGRHGLLYGNGEFVTKHHAAIVSRLPPPQGVTVGNDDLQPQVEAAYGSVPAVDETYEGPCTVESFLLRHDAKGLPDRGTVVGRTPGGLRVLGRVTGAEPEVLQWLARGDADPVGKTGHVFRRGDGWTHFALERPAQVEPPAVRFEKVAPHVVLVTIDRPQQRNAVNGAVARLLAQYVDQVENDPDIRVAILAGAGGSFCAGADLMESRAGRGQDLVVGRKGFAGFVTARRTKPWIAAVNGFALGGGTELVLACDLAIAGEDARFGLPEVSRSLIAGAGGLVRLPRVLPQRIALELILTGRAIDARQALSLHLVNRVVAGAAVIDEAVKLAGEIAANAPLAVRESLQIARRSAEEPEAALHRAGMEAIGRLVATRDFTEGLTAFAEKRPPEWTGR